jgi:polysaccharide deacetylase family protein (PEP-CTERM system associated)
MAPVVHMHGRMSESPHPLSGRGVAPSTPGRGAAHLFSVDVEEHFQVGAFEKYVGRETWDTHPSRVERNVGVLLDLLAEHDAHGTFFTLGWVAERRPAVVRRIAEAGHEVASHGWWHRRVTGLSAEEFREDVRSSKAILEDLSGHAVIGFRAPNFSIRPEMDWAFEVLIEEGYHYDSSLFPIRRPGHGHTQAPPIAYYVERLSGALLEFPLATLDWRRFRLPAAGGAYLRHLPYALTRHAFRQNTLQGMPGMFYIHPWEVDPEQPRIRVPFLTRLRHYGGLRRTVPRLSRLLSEFRFTSVARHLAEYGLTSTHELPWGARTV